MPKIYFYDNGIRNMIIQNLNSVDLRDDVGQLFENYFISEKIKQRKHREDLNNVYFWRSKDGQEIDFLEIYQNPKKIYVYECKYTNKSVKIPPAFEKKYSNSEFKLVNKENIFDFFK